MASLTCYPKGYKVRYRVHYPDGANRVAYAYRSTQREAMRLKGQAESPPVGGERASDQSPR